MTIKIASPGRVGVLNPDQRTTSPSAPGRTLTGLNGASIIRRPDSGGRSVIWLAESADGCWAYERVDDARTTWTVTHIPSGEVRECFPTLDHARTWTGSGGGVDALRDEVLARVSGTSTPQRRDLRALRILTGRILTNTAALGPEALCYCGAYLVLVDRAWVHLDVCRSCETVGERDVCTANDRTTEHGAGCDHPAPAQCDHPHCIRTSVLPAECEWDHPVCCGCCKGHHDTY